MTTIYTVGHGNRSIEEFTALLRDAGIECLVDVRAYPASRRHPQFAQDALAESLSRAGIRYVWQGKALGGRRKPRANSPHIALRNESFRAYADHMGTPEFKTALDQLIEQGGNNKVAIMCAERLPWQCHRYLISDSLVARGVEVRHQLDKQPPKAHALNPAARIENGLVIYNGRAQLPLV